MLREARVSVLIPCLNEAQGLRRMLPQMPAWVDEVLVVDNGSTDDSAAVAEARGARVVGERVRGYGAACRRGLREATGEIIVKLDGDCTYPLEAIRVLAETALYSSHTNFGFWLWIGVLHGLANRPLTGKAT